MRAQANMRPNPSQEQELGIQPAWRKLWLQDS